ncbi:SIR2 family NAD-dependent protein deacylase [Paracoccus versutus]|uniref:SIR2 family NAD-dependent protein deacylase n=1 Tax=Paracoccus versutus TaxID=34007 RepID=UPI000DF7D03B|nr:SIR2 family protein [Paracoccus versutus]RDD72741.1 SIR2 family protein [Paracoccus versutus]
MAFNPSLMPEPLIQEYSKGRVGLLVGAGASAGAGLPMWGKFLEDMLTYAKSSGSVSDAKAANYAALIETGKYLPAASGLKAELGSYFADYVKKIFVDSRPKPTALHDAMLALDQLQFVLTTNYDTLLERTFRTKDADVTVCTYKDAGEVRRSLHRREFFILKAHGDASRSGDGIILTEQDYRAILFKEPAYQHMLATMFSMYTMVFVGASMTDPELNLMLNYVASTFQPDSGPTHYAALTKERINEIEMERWFKDFKIKVIPVSEEDEYVELTEMIKILAKSTTSPGN